MANKIRIVCIGKVKEKHILEGIQEYEKRLKPFCELEIIELKDEGITKEAEKIAKHLAHKTLVLDAAGKQMTSEEFADLIKKEESPLTFIIGGPEGISEGVKKKSMLLSMSKMTFTHEMSRLFLIEQIYRAYTIINRRAYHK